MKAGIEGYGVFLDFHSKNEEKLIFTVSDCSFKVNGRKPVMVFNQGVCENCLIERTKFEIYDKTTYVGETEQSFVVINEGMWGSLKFDNTTFTRGGGLRLKEAMVTVKSAPIDIIFENLLNERESANYFLLSGNLGSLVLKNSVFKKVALDWTPFILIPDLHPVPNPYLYKFDFTIDNVEFRDIKTRFNS